MRPFRNPFWVVLLASVVLAACEPSQVAPPPPPDAPQAAGEDKSPPLRGTIVPSTASLVLQECGTVAERTIQLIDPRREVASLPGVETPATVPIYVELRGTPSPGGKAFTVDRVERARDAHAGVACEPPLFAGDFEVRGEEPFFAIDILETGIVFRSPDEPKGVTYPYGVTPNATGRREYATKLEGARPSTLDVVLEQERCVDAMSGEVFGYKAHVTRNGTKLEACAAAGVSPGGFGDAPLDELARWLGTYPTTSTWTTPPLGARLDVLLGPQAAAFRQNVEVRSPVMKDGGIYYVTGNKSHQGGIDNAIVMADPATDTINVILVKNGVRRNFREGDRAIEPPDDVKKTLESLRAP